MTAAADREAFERHYAQHNYDSLQKRYVASECYLAGLAHARQEADDPLDVLEELESAKDALPEGYRVDAEHDLAARVRELAALYGRHADALRKIGALEAENDYLKERIRTVPAPLTAAERAVVDAAMAEHALRVAGRPDYDYRAAGALHEACAALAAEREPKPAQVYPDLPDSAFITTDAERDVLAERRKQRAKWGDAHDDGHEDGDLIDVAEDILLESDDRWGLRAKHPERRDQLVIAAALIVAEIERRDRAATPKPVDPWATLEGVLHRLEQDVEVNELSADRSDWYRLWMRDYDRIREMLKNAVSQREGGAR